MPLEPGASIGDYQVLALLGSGGMGRVYKVQNLLSNRIEAMKVLVSDIRNQGDLTDRFLREMQVHARLVHPNIAAMHTALRLDNQLVMVMEFVEGATIEDRLRSGNLSVREAIDYARQMLSALSYAHRQGVVHRDIKPSNVMVTPEGVVKVMDFGLAAGEADKRLTRSGSLVGSLYYMSPEQVKGGACSPQTDIYSAGLTLYEMLTGVRGIHGDSDFALMNAHLTEQPEAPTRLNPAIPSSLSEVVLRSISKNPADRFRSADDFREALGKDTPPAKSADLEPTKVLTPAPAPRTIPPPTARSRKMIPAFAIGVVLIGGGIAYKTWSSSTPATSTPSATASPAAPPAAEVPAPQPVPASPAPKSGTAQKSPIPASAGPAPTPPGLDANAAPPAEDAEEPEPPITRPKREAARHEISEVLDRLRAAYSSRDFKQLETLWPKSTPEARGRFAALFSQAQPVEFTFRVNGDPTVEGTKATVRDHFDRSGNKKGPARRTLVIRMTHAASSWVIDSINFAAAEAK